MLVCLQLLVVLAAQGLILYGSASASDQNAPDVRLGALPWQRPCNFWECCPITLSCCWDRTMFKCCQSGNRPNVHRMKPTIPCGPKKPLSSK